jgi:hypothetical protein
MIIFICTFPKTSMSLSTSTFVILETLFCGKKKISASELPQEEY